MLLEATSRPIRYRLNDGRELVMEPGVPVELPDLAGRRLLQKAGGKVRLVSQSSDVVLDLAAPNARPVYWKRVTGIVGPAQPEFLAMVGCGSKASYWVVAQFEGLPVWINSLQLRSKRQFEQQVPLKAVELERKHGYAEEGG